jgi:hypothetical protein
LAALKPTADKLEMRTRRLIAIVQEILSARGSELPEFAKIQTLNRRIDSSFRNLDADLYKISRNEYDNKVLDSSIVKLEKYTELAKTMQELLIGKSGVFKKTDLLKGGSMICLKSDAFEIKWRSGSWR